MCQHREHRYRMVIKVEKEPGYKTVSSVTVDLVVNAHGLAEAVAKADGWAVAKYGSDTWFEVTIHRAGYGSVEGAKEHGAILPEDYR